MVEQVAMIAGSNGYMPFALGKISTLVIGGPYMRFVDRQQTRLPLVGVLMAEELRDVDYTIFVPTRDFSIPLMRLFRKGLMQSIAQMAIGNQLYVGCMGGIGRTGLFLAGLAKIMGVEDPVGYVREHYIPHAVETEAQKDFIRALKVEDIRKWAKIIS